MPRFFIPQGSVQNRRALLTGQELEHMRRVLRLRPGDEVTLFDEAGWEHEAVIRSYAAEAAKLEIVGSHQPNRESALQVILAQALGKGDKMDWIVEKATELGVGVILPFLSSYTVPKLQAAKSEHRRERWNKIALSAVKQSGRTRAPEIGELTDFKTLVRAVRSCDLKLFFWEKESARTMTELKKERPVLTSVLLVVGPEGGFSSEEAAEAARQGLQSVSLGRRILRSETAGLAAVCLAQFLWGDLR